MIEFIVLSLIGYAVVGIFVEMAVQPVEWNKASTGIVILWPLFVLGAGVALLRGIGYLGGSCKEALEILVKGSDQRG